jgi:hypothetical protein
VVTYLTYATSTDGQNFWPRSWVLIAPPDSRAVSIPALPDDLASFDVTAGTGIASHGFVNLVDLGQADGWDAARALPVIAFSGNIDFRAYVDGYRSSSNGVTFEAP